MLMKINIAEITAKCDSKDPIFCCLQVSVYFLRSALFLPPGPFSLGSQPVALPSVPDPGLPAAE